MYNDEQNLYHYTYRKDGSETAPGAPLQTGPFDSQPNQGGGQPPVQEMKPVK